MLITTLILFILSIVPVCLGKTLKTTCSVDVSKYVAKIMKVGFVVTFVILTVSTIICSVLLRNIWATFLHLLWLVIMTSLAFKTFESANQCHKKLLEFHNFLVEFR